MKFVEGHLSEKSEFRFVNKEVQCYSFHFLFTAEDDRTVRRESYLKATEGGRVHFDSDHSDTGDISPQALRG